LIGTGFDSDSGPHDTIIIVINAPDFNPERVKTFKSGYPAPASDRFFL